MTIKYYNSPEERKALKKAANNSGESTIHDDFVDLTGKITDGTKGRLTFEVIVDTPDTDFIRQKQLKQKLQDGSINFEEVKEYLRLRI